MRTATQIETDNAANAADGATAAAVATLVAGKDGSGNQQDVLVDTTGRIEIIIAQDDVGIGGGTQYTDDTSTHATGSSVGTLLMAAATPTDSAVDVNDIGSLAMTTDRKLHVSVQDALPAGTADIGEINTRPIEPSNINSAVYETSHVIKASAGTIYEVRGYNSGPAQWIQIHDASSLPADTAVPEDIVYAAGSDNFWISFRQGKACATGIVVSNSTTGPTKTIGAADCWFSAEYL